MKDTKWLRLKKRLILKKRKEQSGKLMFVISVVSCSCVEKVPPTKVTCLHVSFLKPNII